MQWNVSPQGKHMCVRHCAGLILLLARIISTVFDVEAMLAASRPSEAMAVVAPGGGNGPPDRRPWNWKSYEKWDPPYADDDGDADDEEDSDDTDDLRRCHKCGKKTYLRKNFCARRGCAL